MTGRPEASIMQSPRGVSVLFTCVLVTCSGAAALAYELSWARQLGAILGQSAQTAGVVLAAYFGGLALGSWLAARWVERLDRPLQGYALAEWGVALAALVMPLLVHEGGLLHRAILLPIEAPGARIALRVVLSAFVLLPATTALGASLPFVAHFLTEPGAKPGRAVALAYACNIAGAVLGAVVTTWFSLWWLGVRKTALAAAGVSILCGVAAWWVASREAPREKRARARPSKSSWDGAQRVWVLVAVVSGAGTLALEVFYTRLFALVLHNSTYTFGVVLTVCLVGLAAGAAIFGWLGERTPVRRIAIVASALAAIAIPTSISVFLGKTHLRSFAAGSDFSGYVWGVTALAAVVAGPVFVMAGMLLPCAWRAAARGGDGGQVVGRLTAYNTMAGASGSLAASFLLLPWLGLWVSFAVAAVAYGLLLVFLEERWVIRGLGIALAVGAGFSCSIHKDERAGLRSYENLVWHGDSPHGWVQVVRDERRDNLRLRMNVRYGLGSSNSTPMERRQGHLPLLLHPKPRSVAFIGLATGITAGAALDHPSVGRVDIAELVPAVVEAARLFAPYNRGVHDDPRVRIHLEDGRHFLQGARQKYDVIVADLFVPWESRTGDLYTVEHYQAVSRRLGPGGIFCQWLPLWQLGARELQMIADGFADVFPETSVWIAHPHANHALLALIGSDEPLRLNLDEISERLAALPEIPRGKERVLTSGAALAGLYWGDWQASDGLRNTDEHPRIEFLAPITHRQYPRLTNHTLRWWLRVHANSWPRQAVVDEGGGPLADDFKKRLKSLRDPSRRRRTVQSSRQHGQQ